MNESQIALATQIGQKMFDREMASYPPERLAKVSQEEIERHRQFLIQSQIDRAREFLNPVHLVSRVMQGALHPATNKLWRELFTGLTGVRLPQTVSGTLEAVRQHIGADEFDRLLREREERKEQKRQEEMNAKAEKLREYQEKTREDYRTRLENGESLRGDELVEAAFLFGMEIHPRTAGMLRKRVVAINDHQGRVIGKHPLPNSAFQVYRDLQKLIA